MDTSPLDYVAQACMDLTEALGSCNKETERESLITNHIKKVFSSVTPVEDFKRSKYLFESLWNRIE